MVEAGSVDLVVSWESLVYVERETLASYFRELARVLAPGGAAFIHHGNLGAHERELEGRGPDERTAGRRPSQTAERAAADAREAGLRCVAQELVPFYERGLWTDCFTLVTRDELNAGRAPEVAYAHDWGAELAVARRVGGLYRA
jgi:SAM-dependent methyltransferase